MKNMVDPWLNSCDSYLLPLPLGKTLHTTPTHLLPGFAARATRLSLIWSSSEPAFPKRWRPNFLRKGDEEKMISAFLEMHMRDSEIHDYCSANSFLHILPGSKWTVVSRENEICLYNPDTDGSGDEEAFLKLGVHGDYVCASQVGDQDGAIWLVLLKRSSTVLSPGLVPQEETYPGTLFSPHEDLADLTVPGSFYSRASVSLRG